MKKILALIGVIGLTTTSSLTVVACQNSSSNNSNNDEQRISLSSVLQNSILKQFSQLPTKEELLEKVKELNSLLDLEEVEVSEIGQDRAVIKVKDGSSVYQPGTAIVRYTVDQRLILGDIITNRALGEFAQLPEKEQILENIQDLNLFLDLEEVEVSEVGQDRAVIKVKDGSSVYQPGTVVVSFSKIVISINGQVVNNNSTFELIPWNDYEIKISSLNLEKLKNVFSTDGFEFNKVNEQTYKLAFNKMITESISEWDQNYLAIGDFKINFIVEKMLPRWIKMWEGITTWEQNTEDDPINFRKDEWLGYKTSPQSWMSIEALKLWFLTGMLINEKNKGQVFVLDLAQDIIFDNFEEYQGTTWGWQKDTFWNIAFHSKRYKNLGNYNYYFRNNFSLESWGNGSVSIFESHIHLNNQSWIFDYNFWSWKNPVVSQWMERNLFQYSGQKYLEFINSMYGNQFGAYQGSNLFETVTFGTSTYPHGKFNQNINSYEQMAKGSSIGEDQKIRQFGAILYQANPYLVNFTTTPINRKIAWDWDWEVISGNRFHHRDDYTLNFISNIRVVP